MTNLTGAPVRPERSTTIPFPAVEPGYRLVPARVGKPCSSVTVWTECPTDWCIVDHVAEPVGSAEDINHQGAPAALNLAADQTASVPTEVYLSWWPGSKDVASRPCLAVDVDYEVAVYGRTAALALVDQLTAFAEDVRRLAETLPDDSPAATLAPSAVTA
ncbi:hypothetical protein ABZY36_35470 [Streptomyces sp. NPDC006627]|uniref:DUF6907 domain-containing protein n=1 Tax=Streptomyces sp. NPDC006627 TaxID=3154679 RepID=UPI0033B75E75